MTDPAKPVPPTRAQPAGASLTQRAGRSVIWQVGSGAAQTVVRLGASMVLARLLIPADFGLFGMALLFQEVIGLLGPLGMGSGIVAKKNLEEDDLCTCFWATAVVLAVLFVLTWTAAPLAGLFFKNTAVVPVIRVVAYTYLLMILSMIGHVLFMKRLQFGALALITSISVFIESAAAIVMAVFWRSDYWALVAAMMIGVSIKHAAIFFAAGWVPKLRFKKASFQYLFHFGINEMGIHVGNYLMENIDYLTVGRLLGARVLGLYEFAYKIPHLVVEQVVKPVNAVIFPSLAEIQDRDEDLISGYIRSVKYILVFILPVLGALFVLVEPLVLLLWGDKWIAIITPLKILSACAAARCFAYPVGNVFMCKKRPEIMFRFTWLMLIWTAICVGLCGHWLGLNGVAWGMLLSTAAYPLIILRAFRLTNASVVMIVRPVSSTVFTTLISMAASFGGLVALRDLFESYLVQLSGGALVFAIVYIGANAVFCRATMREMIHILGDILGKGKRLQ